MGSPSMNLLPARIVSHNGVAMMELARDSEAPIMLRVPPTVVSTLLEPGREVILGIRPEAITDPDGADRASIMVESVEAKVEVVEPAGSDTYVVTHAAGAR